MVKWLAVYFMKRGFEVGLFQLFFPTKFDRDMPTSTAGIKRNCDNAILLSEPTSAHQTPAISQFKG
jgi:hypothetical protein